MEVDDRVAVRGHRHLEGLGHAVGLGVVEPHLHLDLRHLVGGVEHHDLLGGARPDDAGREHPHLRRHRSAEPEGDALERRIGAVEGLDPIDDHPPAADLDLGRHLGLPGDVLVDEGADDAATGHHEVLEPERLPGALVGGEVDGDGGVVGERVHEHEQLARAPLGDAPRERPRRRRRGAARGGGAATALRERGDLVLDGDLAAFDLDDRARRAAP